MGVFECHARLTAPSQKLYGGRNTHEYTHACKFTTAAANVYRQPNDLLQIAHTQSHHRCMCQSRAERANEIMIIFVALSPARLLVGSLLQTENSSRPRARVNQWVSSSVLPCHYAMIDFKWQADAVLPTAISVSSLTAISSKLSCSSPLYPFPLKILVCPNSTVLLFTVKVIFNSIFEFLL